MAVSIVTLQDTLEHYCVTREQLAVPCSEPLCNNFAAKVDRWELLAPNIGLSEGDIVEIKEDCKTYQEQRLGSLRKWRSKLGIKATVLSLAEALFEIKRSDLVGELCRVYLSIITQREIASQATDSKPTEVPVEYERLLGCKHKLISEISCDLQAMSRKLAEKDLIPPSLVVDCEAQDSQKKATEIVEVVLDKVRLVPAKYRLLMNVLSEPRTGMEQLLNSGEPGELKQSDPGIKRGGGI